MWIGQDDWNEIRADLAEIRVRLIALDRSGRRREDKENMIMIDTSKILAEVARERTESASLRVLVDGQSAMMKDLGKQLADAIAANDPAALAKVQADLNQAAADLSTDNDAADAAIKANTPPAAAAPATPPA